MYNINVFFINKLLYTHNVPFVIQNTMVRNVLYTIVCASKNDMSLHLLYDSVNNMCDAMKSCVLCIQE